VHGVRIPVNLSSEPFRRDRPIVVASAFTALLLFGILIFLVTNVIRQREMARESREAMEALTRQVQAANAEFAKLESEARQPMNADVLQRNAFLNTLLQRKGISWTRMFDDLESVFPASVRLVSVRPYILGESEVHLDMIVGSQTPEPVIDLLKRLEESKMFGGTALLSSQPPSQNEPLYRYRVSVNYAQKL
jgi:Tfp pilus assembly protein PilN